MVLAAGGTAPLLRHAACLLACARHLGPRAAVQGGGAGDLAQSPELLGRPLSPVVSEQSQDSILLRYAYEGGSLSQGRLCNLEPEPDGTVTGRILLLALKADGVDLARFYPCAYETEESGGGWLPVLREVTDPAAQFDDPVRVPTVPPSAPAAGKRTPQLDPPSTPEPAAVDTG